MPRIRGLTTQRFGRGVVIGALLVAIAVLATSAAAKDERPPPERRVDPSTILVRFTSAASARAGIRAEGDRSVGTLPGGVRVVRVAAGRSIRERVAAYGRRGGVVYAEPNYVRSSELTAPDDPSYGAQWALPAIRAVEAWSIQPGSYSGPAGPKIAILDTGVLSPHPDLAANVDLANAATCTSGTCLSSSALDDHGHGTHVAGIAAAVTNNGIGMAGVGFASPIIPVKVLGANGSGTDASVAAGIAWAVTRGARVLNLSLGAPSFSQTLCNAVASATSAGVVVVAAAGNDGSSTPFYPAACPGAIGVAATASDGSSPSFSNWGAQNVFVSAPGASIFSTYRTSLGAPTYATISGTSMAAPHVSGLAGLLTAQGPTMTPAEFEEVLARSSEKVGADLYPSLTYGADPNGVCAGCTWHPYYGYGEIDALAALCLRATARIESVSTASSDIGASVSLVGTNVGCAAAVSLGDVAAAFTVDSPTAVTATVPSGVGYGYWKVSSAAGTTTSPHVFTVTSPNIAAFAPANAPAGSTVVIEGSGFTDATSVTLGNVAATFTVLSPTRIRATVPAGVEYGRWRVANSVWTAEHPLVFNVASGRRAQGSMPYTGAVGSTVTLTGSGFGSATSVSLDTVPASFTIDGPTRLTATVPAGVSYGRWNVTTATGTITEQMVFTVSAPSIASFSATHGPAGSTVTLLGSGFSGATSVSLGFVPATFTVDSPTQITATVPTGVAYGRWRVANAVWTAVHPLVFSLSSP
jgi:thermitase